MSSWIAFWGIVSLGFPFSFKKSVLKFPVQPQIWQLVIEIPSIWQASWLTHLGWRAWLVIQQNSRPKSWPAWLSRPVSEAPSRQLCALFLGLSVSSHWERSTSLIMHSNGPSASASWSPIILRRLIFKAHMGVGEGKSIMEITWDTEEN